MLRCVHDISVLEASVLRKAVCNAERLLGSAIWGSARGWHTSQYAILADHLKSEAAKQPGNLAFTIHAVRCDVTSGGRDILLVVF